MLRVATFRAWSSFTTLSCPLKVAHRSGVWPQLPRISGLTSSRPNRSFTAPSCPLYAAHDSGVRPPSSGPLGLTSSRSNSSFTTPSFPFRAAHKSGVWPRLFGRDCPACRGWRLPVLTVISRLHRARSGRPATVVFGRHCLGDRG